MSMKVTLKSNNYIATHRFTLRGYANSSAFGILIFCAMGLGRRSNSKPIAFYLVINS